MTLNVKVKELVSDNVDYKDCSSHLYNNQVELSLN